MAERITNLSAPPIIGRFYLVPTVDLKWYHWREAWPVFLPKHEDGRFTAVTDTVERLKAALSPVTEEAK